MNAKTIALIITFSALAMALNPAISGMTFPFPLMPTLYFQIWEIPLIIAFMLFGFKVALPADLLNAIFLATFFPGPSQPYYSTSAIATFGMMLGIYLGLKLVRHRAVENEPYARTKFVTVSLALSIFFRVVFMAAVMFSILYFDPLSVYPQIPARYIAVVVLPPQAIFNIIMPLYTVPIAYGVANVVNRNLKINTQMV